VIFYSGEILMTVFERHITAYAKINWFLKILGTREDGYHLLKTLMESVSLSDTVSLVCSDSAGKDGLRPGIQLTANLPFIPTDSKNTAYKAARAYLNALGRKDISVGIHIEKRIPTQAGMGGGSADAAAVLNGLADIFPEAVSRRDLMTIAAGIGADVPFCMDGGTQLCEGIGDILKPVGPLDGLPLLFIKPRCSVSTPWAFGEFDRISALTSGQAAGTDRLPDESSHESRCSRGNGLPCKRSSRPVHNGAGRVGSAWRLKAAAPWLENDLESVAESRFPELSDIRGWLDAHGAVFSRMSGSGSTLFGVFEKADARDAAFCEARAYFGETYFVEAGTTL
jgi:4-diphosphocytidyl-2-C-methyl-D-erythritol kinase